MIPIGRGAGKVEGPVTEAAYCPCGGTCHHSESPCSLGCWAAQKPWRAEEAAQAARAEVIAERDAVWSRLFVDSYCAPERFETCGDPFCVEARERRDAALLPPTEPK